MYIRGQVNPKQKGEAEKIANLMVDSYKLCFCANSTEKWVRMFGRKRLDMLIETQEEEYQNILSKNFLDKVLKIYTDGMLDYIEECKKNQSRKAKEQSEREKEALKKHGAKRKKD